jgi:4-hydroxy-tetrahydrodipicolinate synthase
MTFGISTKGVYPIAATPFNEDMSVDWNSLDRLTDFYEEAGATGITILGILGEAGKLEPEESREIALRVIKRAKVPIVVGVSNPSFSAMGRLAKEVMDIGAAGVMIAGHAGLRSDEQIAAHFRNAVEAIGADTPWALQDYPLTLSVVLSVPMISRIMADYPSCVMLKAEDWPQLEKLSTIRREQAAGRLKPFSILTANGGLFLDLEPGRGSDGAMTGYAFPDALVEMDTLHRSGRRDDAHDLFDAHLPMIRMEQQANIGLAVRKYLLKRRGAIACDIQRRPGSSLTAQGREEIDYLLSRLGKRDPRARLQEPFS